MAIFFIKCTDTSLLTSLSASQNGNTIKVIGNQYKRIRMAPKDGLYPSRIKRLPKIRTKMDK
jgi:hypothetical protein